MDQRAPVDAEEDGQDGEDNKGWKTAGGDRHHLIRGLGEVEEHRLHNPGIIIERNNAVDDRHHG